MKKPTDEEINGFITSLDDDQLKFVVRLLGALPEGTRSDCSRVFIRGYQEEVRRLYRRAPEILDRVATESVS